MQSGRGRAAGGRPAPARKGGPSPKGGVRQSVRFTHEDVYAYLHDNWKDMGFDSFSSAVDFALALAFGKWRELGFATQAEGRKYLAAFARREVVQPPRSRPGQETLPLAGRAA
ncbi:hypothetical protein GCM10017673_37460 [Streptosporangium violaceochromogenes]|nr:hypothetical protein GCM10017673_37460 [Streptosporangium violaceochromogenes]